MTDEIMTLRELGARACSTISYRGLLGKGEEGRSALHLIDATIEVTE